MTGSGERTSRRDVLRASGAGAGLLAAGWPGVAGRTVGTGLVTGPGGYVIGGGAVLVRLVAGLGAARYRYGG
jgi:hypothetical protein